MHILTNKPINVSELHDTFLREVEKKAGAVITFVGCVRENNRGKRVRGIYYECYIEMAEYSLGEIISHLKNKYNLLGILIVHRYGYVKVGEVSLVVMCASERRVDAMRACVDAVELIKSSVPIWKKEIYEDGEEWI